MAYRFLLAPDHPLATAWGTVLEHRAVLYDVIGPGTHSCHWCGKTVSWSRRQGGGGTALTVDHLDNDPQNNDVTNLVPACTRCNTRRHRTDGVRDDEHYITAPNRRGRVRAEELTCAECGDKFLAPRAEAHRRRFCSRPCMYAGRFKPR